MTLTRGEMDRVVGKLSTKSAKIRALAAAGVKRADIARYLDIRYQHVRNVLTQSVPRAASAVSANGEGEAGAEERVRITVGPGGRIVIPAALRAKMGAEEGRALVAHLVGGELKLATPATLMRRAQKLVRDLLPDDVRLAEELIAERRREAEKE
jgi:bifunctional DNA-binding transcriptional regulator/antitoxin component of YhaV-PrlF toxin-antitoxin module